MRACCMRACCSPKNKDEEAQGLIGTNGGRSDDVEHGGSAELSAESSASTGKPVGSHSPLRKPRTADEKKAVDDIKAETDKALDAMKVAANKAIEVEQAVAVAVEAVGKIPTERAAAEKVTADKAASALAAAEKAEQDEAHKNRFAVPSAITIKMLEEYKRRVKSLVPKGIKYEDYFPAIVLSYASGRRPDDCEGSGPGVMYAMGLMEFFHERGLQCFSGLQVPPGVDWETFMLRLTGENGKREKPKVLIIILTAALYQSKPCLKEIDTAIKHEVELLPVRFEDKLPGKAEQWTNLKGQDWEMRKFRVQEKLNSLNNIPNPGTVLDRPGALDDIMAELPVPDGQVEKDGFALRALLPETDAPLLQSLEALLQTEHPDSLGTGRDVSKKYGKYDSLKLACAWKVDHPRNLARYTTGMKRVQEELKLLRMKGKDVSNVPVRTARVHGFTLSEACNEVILLHGANPGRLLALLSTGLNERYAGGGAGTAFGDGVYLAEDAGKTDQYVGPDSAYEPSSELHNWLYSETVPHPEDVLYVLVVRAALGFPVRTQHTLDNSKRAKTHDLRAARVTSMDDGTPIFPRNCRELPAVPDVTPPICHHSLIAELGLDIVRYREFVLFHSEFVHVDYVIAYHRYNGDQKLRMTDSMTNSMTDSPV